MRIVLFGTLLLTLGITGLNLMKMTFAEATTPTMLASMAGVSFIAMVIFVKSLKIR